MRTKYPELKLKLKQLAQEIREMKSRRKATPFGYVKGLISSQWIFRNNHVAYCLLHGTSYDLIEKPNSGNEINMGIVDNIVMEYKTLEDLRDEAIHTCMQEAV